MEYELLVAGGGIAGVSLARMASDAGLRTLLLESTPRLGGALDTLRLPHFWLELGAHTLFNSYGTLITQLGGAGLARTRLLSRRRLPYRFWTDQGSRPIFPQLHLTELVRAVWRAPRLRREGLSVADYFSALAGPRNWAQVLSPALDAVICQSAGQFPADALFRRKPRRRDFPRSFSLEGGVSAVIELLAQGLEVRTGAGVEEIEGAPGRWRVRAGGNWFSAPHVALAVPVQTAAALLRPVAPGAAGELAGIDHAGVESVGVALRADRLKLPAVAGLIGRGQPFFSMVSRDTIPHPELRGFTFHFRPGVLDAAGRRETIARVLGVEAGSWEAEAAALHTLPSLRLGHHERMARVEQALPAGLHLTGNYFAGVSVEECVGRSAIVAERVMG